MMGQSEREKMLSDQPYRGSDPELIQARARARELLGRFNASSPLALAERRSLLLDLIGGLGPDVWIEPPFFCDYGSHIRLGPGVYCNFGCVILDCNWVEIGGQCKFGPNVQIYTAYHPIDPDQRRSGLEMASPIRIGENVWVGGGSIICPGVEIGADTVIGAGSVVTKSLPARVVAAGNPCRVIRTL